MSNKEQEEKETKEKLDKILVKLKEAENEVNKVEDEIKAKAYEAEMKIRREYADRLYPLNHKVHEIKEELAKVCNHQQYWNQYRNEMICCKCGIQLPWNPYGDDDIIEISD